MEDGPRSVRLGYDDEGDGPAVLFVHGLAGDRETFAAQAQRLADRYRSIRVDLRGHGASPCPPGPWSIADLSRDLASLLDALGRAPAHVVAHSAGGVFAMALALERPELVASLFLVGTSAELKPEIAERSYLRWAAIAESDGLEAALRAMGMPAPREPAPPRAALGLARTCRAIATLATDPIAPRLSEIRCPTLYLVGERDPFGVGGSVRASRAVPGAELLILPEAGHAPFREQPRAFDARLAAFLDRRT